MTLSVASVVAWALGASIFTLAALLRLGRAAPARDTQRHPLRVFLLRPVDAPSSRELENFAQPLNLPWEVRHVVVSPYRPRLPEGVEWLYSDPTTPNRKVGHLLYALEVLPTAGALVISVDSDVAVDGALLQGLVQPLLHGCGLSTAAPTPSLAPGLSAHAFRGLLCHTHHSFLALDAMSVGAKAVSGKALGLGREAQEELARVADHIGEDLELAKRLHARGVSVGFAPVPARVPQAADEPFGQLVERIMRWMQVLRAHRPALYPTVPLLFAPTLPLVLFALVLQVPALSLAVALLVMLRMALALRLALPGERRAAAWDWALGEGLLLLGFVRSLGARGVTWRGRRFSLLAGGRMLPVLGTHGDEP